MKLLPFHICVLIVAFSFGATIVWIAESHPSITSKEISQQADSFSEKTTQRFTEIYFASDKKQGYAHGYKTNDGIILREGTLDCQKPAAHDPKIIQTDDTKIVTKFTTLSSEYYVIYLRKSGHCISAPSVNLGLELRDHLKNIIYGSIE